MKLALIKRVLPMMLVLGWQSLCASARDVLPEYVLKAGYLYHFGELTEWPETALKNNFELCFYGNEDVGLALASLRGKKINNQTINVRYVRHAVDARVCNMIFIAAVNDAQSAAILKEVSSLPILTVTDDAGLMNQGVVIFMRPEGPHLVFEIDNSVAKEARLSISSRLLRLAR